MMKPYRSLFTRSKSQDVATAFAYFYPVQQDYDEPFKTIARKTVDGYAAWGFTQDRFKAKHSRSEVPKLKNYLDYTFVRLLDMEQVTPGAHFRYSVDHEWVAFNTGLQNAHAVDLMAVFQRFNPRDDLPPKPHTDWVFKGCYATNERGYRDHFGSGTP